MKFSSQAFRRITRPLIREDSSFDRKKIFAEARRRFARGEAKTWSAAMVAAWELAHNQIELAMAFDAAPVAIAARKAIADERPAIRRAA